MGTYFWEDVWASNKPLKFQFPRLYSLSLNKRQMVGESGFWEGDTWVWRVEWRRELREREKGMVEDLLLTVLALAPCTGAADGWRWLATTDDLFSTKSAYEILTAAKGDQQMQSVEISQVWEAPTPYKAKVIAWRCLSNRLAMCDNLLRRNIQIGVEERWCNACVSYEETAEHVFLHCPKAEAVWDQIHQWLDIKTAKPRGILQHFISFISGGKGKNCRRLLKALWVGTIWLLWESRNVSRFQGKVWEINRLVLQIKGRLWSWNEVFKVVKLDVSFTSWCSKGFKLSLLF